MTRTAELALKLADGEIVAAEVEELCALTSADAGREECIRLLEIEALLRGMRAVDFVEPTLARLETVREHRIVSGVMARIPASRSPARAAAVVSKSRRWRVWAVAAVMAVVALALVLVPRAAVPCGEIAAVSGDVRIHAEGRKRPAKKGDILRAGERLEVAFESSAEVSWLHENARLTVGELSEVQWESAGLCALRSGSLSADVVSRAGREPLFFKTADASAKITGTKFTLHRSAAATQLRVNEGRVVLADSDSRGSAAVVAGQFAAASDAVVPVAREWPRDGAGVGLLGEYYNHNYQKMDTEPPAYERLDSRIRFQWGKGAPTPVTQAHPEHFGVRWTGFIEPRFSESYTFLLVVDDGARMWVDDRQILDAWDSNSAKKFYTQPVQLTAGRRHKIRLEYCERTQQANVSLFWQSLSQPMEVVPQTQLHPPDRADLPPPGTLRSIPARGK